MVYGWGGICTVSHTINVYIIHILSISSYHAPWVKCRSRVSPTHALGRPLSFQNRKHESQHFGRLFLPERLKKVPCYLNEMRVLVNFREESINGGVGQFCRLEVPTDGQLAQFRFFLSKRGELRETGRLFIYFSQFRFFNRSSASWPSVGIRACKIGQSH